MAVKHARAAAEEGATLVEMLVGLAIGLFILLGIMSLFGSASSSMRFNTELSQLQDTGRVIGRRLARDIMTAGYYGLVPNAGLIAGRKGAEDALAATAANDCEPKWFIDVVQPLAVYDESSPYPITCMPTALYRDGSDSIALRFAEPGNLIGTTVDAGTLLLRTNRSLGSLSVSAGGLSVLGAGDEQENRLVSRAYWIADGSTEETTGLFMTELSRVGAQPTVKNSQLSPLVEDLQFQIGVDTDRDGAVDAFRDSAAGIDPTTVLAVKVWIVLVAKKLSVADGAYTMEVAGATRTYDDGVYRHVLTTTVARRNGV